MIGLVEFVPFGSASAGGGPDEARVVVHANGDRVVSPILVQPGASRESVALVVVAAVNAAIRMVNKREFWRDRLAEARADRRGVRSQHAEIVAVGPRKGLCRFGERAS